MTTSPARRSAQPNARAREIARAAAVAKESVAAAAERGVAQERFLTVFRVNGIISASCRMSTVGRRTVYDWLARDEAFKAAFIDAGEEAADNCEEAAHTRGVVGWDEPVYQGGDQVGTIRKFSDRMLELTLKARRPEKFRERYEHTGAGGGPIQGVMKVTFGGRYKPQPAPHA